MQSTAIVARIKSQVAILTLMVFAILLLQGCTSREVFWTGPWYKSVSPCPPSGEGDKGTKGPANCRPMAYTGSVDNALPAFNDDTGQWIDTGSGLSCGAGSQKCKGYPGLCGGVSCVTHYQGGLCFCSCQPGY